MEVKQELEPGLEAEMCSGLPETDYRGIRLINVKDYSLDNVKVNTNPFYIDENEG